MSQNPAISSDSRLKFTRPDAATYLNMGLPTFDQFVLDNEVPCVWVGERQRFERDDLDAAIARQKAASIEDRKSKACPSQSQRVRRTTTTTFKSEVYDFADQRKKRQKGEQK